MASEPLNVLIVDDDQIAATILSEYLGGMGLPVNCRTVDAVPEYELADDPNIVVTDPEMIGVDLRVAVDQIKSRFPHCRVVIYTHNGEGVGKLVSRFVDAGADALISKSCVNAPLLTAFARVLTGRKWLDPALAGGQPLSAEFAC